MEDLDKEFSARTNKLFIFVFGRTARPMRERASSNVLKEFEFCFNTKEDSLLNNTSTVGLVSVNQYKKPEIPTFLTVKSEKNDVSIIEEYKSSSNHLTH